MDISHGLALFDDPCIFRVFESGFKWQVSKILARTTTLSGWARRRIWRENVSEQRWRFTKKTHSFRLLLFFLFFDLLPGILPLRNGERFPDLKKENREAQSNLSISPSPPQHSEREGDEGNDRADMLPTTCWDLSV